MQRALFFFFLFDSIRFVSFRFSVPVSSTRFRVTLNIMSHRSSSTHTISKAANAPIKKSHQRKRDRSPSPPKSLLQPHSVNALRATVNARLASGTQIINPLGRASGIADTTGASASGKAAPGSAVEYLPGGVPVNKQSADVASEERAAAEASMPGFYCATCHVLSTNQSSYLDHLNSKKRKCLSQFAMLYYFI